MSGRAGVGADLRLDIPPVASTVRRRPATWRVSAHGSTRRCTSWLVAIREATTRGKSAGSASSSSLAGGSSSHASSRCNCSTPRRLARERIRADLDAPSWLAPLRLAPERDPALECWCLLAGGQRDRELVAAWLRLAARPATRVSRPSALRVGARSDRRRNWDQPKLLMLARAVDPRGAEARRVGRCESILRPAICRFARSAGRVSEQPAVVARRARGRVRQLRGAGQVAQGVRTRFAARRRAKERAAGGTAKA